MNKLFLSACLLLVAQSSAWADNWPQWRGPDGTGVSSERNLPIIWNANRNIRWSAELPGNGASTPAIWGDAVFVSSQTDDQKLLVLKIHKRSGKVEWTTEVGAADPPRRDKKSKRGVQTFHRWHNLASPSPVTDGEHVVVHYGNGLLAALDFDGAIVWKRNLQDDYGDYTIWWGHANSPILHNGMVISACMQDALDGLQEKPRESYVVAHDIRDGHVRWRTARPTKATAEQFDAYTTPLLRTINGKRQLILMGGNQLDAYDPADGTQLWKLPGLVGGRLVTNPTAAGDFIYCTRGMRGPLLAVDITSEIDDGELSGRPIKWTYTTGTPDSCSPVLWNDLLFFISDDGIARCLDARFGKLHWKQRLPGAYKASPVAAEGRIFFLNTEGVCTVISASSRFDKLTENKLDDVTVASPVISDGRIFIRGGQRLYCIAKPQ